MVDPIPVLPTPRVSGDAKPEGMVFIPKMEITMSRQETPSFARRDNVNRSPRQTPATRDAPEFGVGLADSLGDCRT